MRCNVFKNTFLRAMCLAGRARPGRALLEAGPYAVSCYRYYMVQTAQFPTPFPMSYLKVALIKIEQTECLSTAASLVFEV
jgi:hypothetical protein